MTTTTAAGRAGECVRCEPTQIGRGLASALRTSPGHDTGGGDQISGAACGCVSGEVDLPRSPDTERAGGRRVVITTVWERSESHQWLIRQHSQFPEPASVGGVRRGRRGPSRVGSSPARQHVPPHPEGGGSLSLHGERRARSTRRDMDRCGGCHPVVYVGGVPVAQGCLWEPRGLGLGVHKSTGTKTRPSLEAARRHQTKRPISDKGETGRDGAGYSCFRNGVKSPAPPTRVGPMNYVGGGVTRTQSARIAASSYAAGWPPFRPGNPARRHPITSPPTRRLPAGRRAFSEAA